MYVYIYGIKIDVLVRLASVINNVLLILVSSLHSVLMSIYPQFLLQILLPLSSNLAQGNALLQASSRNLLSADRPSSIDSLRKSR